ncbi:hypothetical protein ACFX1Q_010393 [Malus domestica]
MGRVLNDGSSSMNFVIAAKKCFTMVTWSLEIFAELAAMLNPVPIGLSRKVMPKILFQEAELGSKARGS